MADMCGKTSTPAPANKRLAPGKSRSQESATRPPGNERAFASSRARANPKRKMKLCKFHVQGCCVYTTENCSFAHSCEEISAAKNGQNRAAKANAKVAGDTYYTREQLLPFDFGFDAQSNGDTETQAGSATPTSVTDVPSAISFDSTALGRPRVSVASSTGTGTVFSDETSSLAGTETLEPLAEDKPNDSIATWPSPLPFRPPPGLEDQVRVDMPHNHLLANAPRMSSNQHCASACGCNSCLPAHRGCIPGNPYGGDRVAAEYFSAAPALHALPRIEETLMGMANQPLLIDATTMFGGERHAAERAHMVNFVMNRVRTVAHSLGEFDRFAEQPFSTQQSTPNQPMVSYLKQLRGELLELRDYCVQHDL